MYLLVRNVYDCHHDTMNCYKKLSHRLHRRHGEVSANSLVAAEFSSLFFHLSICGMHLPFPAKGLFA